MGIVPTFVGQMGFDLKSDLKLTNLTFDQTPPSASRGTLFLDSASPGHPRATWVYRMPTKG